ncbi:MAG: hypothetical protein ACQERK_07530 [Campylobacterota bacterium]
MHRRYSDLKKRCQRYYQKRYLGYAVVVLLLAALAGAGGYVWLYESAQPEARTTAKPAGQKEQNVSKQPPQKEQQEQQTQNKKPPQEQGDDNATNKQPTEQDKDRKPKTHKLQPVYNFEIDELYKQTLPRTQETASSDKQTQSNSKEQKPKPAPKPAANKTPAVKAQPPKEPKATIQISTKKAPTIDEKIEIYEKRPDFQTALAIASQFYEKQEYAQSITWAKKADKLKPSKPEVFSLYARALYFNDQKQKAAQLLRYFLNTKVNEELQQLLNQIQENRLDKED